MCPACPEDGGPGTFTPPDRHRSAPCTSGGWWPWHVQRPFCVLPARRLVVQARSAAIMCPAHPEDGGPDTFCGCSVPRTSGGYACPGPINPPTRHKSVPCPPVGWWPSHVLRRFCVLPAQRLVVLARSAVVLCPGRQKDGGPGTFSGHYVSRLL